MTDDEPEGGDPACWAHLFADDARPCGQLEDDGSGAAGSIAGDVGVVDLAALARSGPTGAIAWSHQSEDLNVNLLVFVAGQGVPEHVNAEVDVLLIGIAGEGMVEIDGRQHALQAGQALVVAKGRRRAIRAISDPLAYLTCHRRRAGLWPAAANRSFDLPQPVSS